jgi:hypothetical protein
MSGNSDIKNLHAAQNEVTALRHEEHMLSIKLGRDLQPAVRDTVYADLLLFRDAIENAEKIRYAISKRIASKHKSEKGGE